MKANSIFVASDNEEIAVTTYTPDAGSIVGTIIYAHGFKGFKDWGFVPHIGEYLSKRGFVTVTFNFSHNGIGPNPLEFTEEDKFSRNTFSREIRELSEIIAACGQGEFGASGDIGVLGHSRGGGIALLTAVNEPTVKAVVTWSAVSTFNRYSDQMKRAWREKGYFEVANKRTGQIMRLNTTLLDDIEAHGNSTLSIEKAVTGLKKPLLIIHGGEDEAVPFADAERLRNWADDSLTEFLCVEKTGHTFGAVHPFTGSNEKLEATLSKTVEFFTKHI
ncbi:MAG: prolyl oligopeptidase family serine peptidase [Candidatus Zixiibacteriota bacterium]